MPFSFSRKVVSGGGGGDLPQSLDSGSSPSFDKIYVTNNGGGTNIKVGDDVWIGDVDSANTISIEGVEDPSQGGIAFGNSLLEKVYSDSARLHLESGQRISLDTSTILNRYANLEFNNYNQDTLARIYVDDALYLEGQYGAALRSYNGNNLEISSSNGPVNITSDQDMTLRSNYGNMQFYMDGAAYIGDVADGNRIAQMKDVPAQMGIGYFYDTNTFGPYASNTEHAVAFETTEITNGVHIGGINSSELILEKTGQYTISVDLQWSLASGGGNTFVWLKKNGTTVPWSSRRVVLTTSNVPQNFAATWMVDATANDAYEIYWSSVGSTIKLEAVTGLTGTKASIPSAAVSVNQVR